MDQILGNISLLFEFPVVNVTIIVEGIMIGCLFALAAYGLALVWGVMNVKNLAQGAFVIMGGYIGYDLARNGIHVLFGVPVAFIIMWGFGWVVYKTVISRVIERDLFTSLLATFGVSIVIEQLLDRRYTSDTQTVDMGFPTFYFLDSFVSVPSSKLIGMVLAIGLATSVIIFMKKSRMGQAIRATAQNARAARVMGIDTEKVYAFTFSLNSAICGAAGAIIVTAWVIQPFYGMTYAIRAFVIVTAAGLGNLPGVIAAGLGIGVAEQYGGHIFGIGYQQAVAVCLLILVLLYRLMQQRRKRQVLE